MRPRFAAAVSILILTLALPAAVGARDTGHSAASERASTIAYWTPERIAHAIPRDFERTSARPVRRQGQARRRRLGRRDRRLVDGERARRDAVRPDPVHDGRRRLHLLRFRHRRHLDRQRLLDGPERRPLRLRFRRRLGHQVDVHPRLRRRTDATPAPTAPSAAGRRPVWRSIRSSYPRAGSTIRPSPSTSRSRGSGWAARTLVGTDELDATTEGYTPQDWAARST